MIFVSSNYRIFFLKIKLPHWVPAWKKWKIWIYCKVKTIKVKIIQLFLKGFKFVISIYWIYMYIPISCIFQYHVYSISCIFNNFQYHVYSNIMYIQYHVYSISCIFQYHVYSITSNIHVYLVINNLNPFKKSWIVIIKINYSSKNKVG